MGLLSNSKFKPAGAPKIRREIVTVEKPKSKSKPIFKARVAHQQTTSSLSSLASPSSSSSSTKKNLRIPAHNGRQTPNASPRISPGRSSASPLPPSSDDRRSTAASKKRKLNGSGASHRPSPASDRIEFGDESSDDDDAWEHTLESKRRRKVTAKRDPDRRLAHRDLTTPYESGRKEPAIIHGAEIANVKHEKCVPLWNATEEEVQVDVQYPGSQQRERYHLLWHPDKLSAVQEILRIAQHVPDVYLTEQQAIPFKTILRQLTRASSDSMKDMAMFKSALDDFNTRLLTLLKDGSIAKNLGDRHELPKELVDCIMTQVYERTVSPKVELLRQYENGSDNVYGELNHNFITDILVERTGMTSNQVFVDLGSGVGNVVLQAALEIGCESWGCEMMENACNFADDQEKEFRERCQLWGLQPGEVHLIRDDFTINARIHKVLPRADVVLVNNQAFTSELNDKLVNMFLDLKPGCKIVSLKSFAHEFKSASYHENSIAGSILDVEMLTYPEEYVSWTGAPGNFCISTRK